jgi:hypothetical protein
MATGAYDANGIWQYGEDDDIALFSDLLNLGQESTSDAFTDDRARITLIEDTLDEAISPKGNALINADFYFNQRSFTSITADNNYGFDRWAFTGSNGTYTPQVFTPGTAPNTKTQGANFARLVSASQSAGTRTALTQRIEDVRNFAGQQVTLSFYAKSGSGTPKIGIALIRNFGSGGSATDFAAIDANTVITTSWGRYSVTLTLPSLTGKTIGTGSYLQLDLLTSVGSTISGTGYPAIGAQNTTVDFWGIQLEAGANATSFKTAANTIQGELAACQRYFIRLQSTGTVALAFGFQNQTTSGQGVIPLPVTMRAAPSGSQSNCLWSDDVSFANALSSFNVTTGTNTQAIRFSCGFGSGGAQFRPGQIRGSGTGTIDLSAEL